MVDRQLCRKDPESLESTSPLRTLLNVENYRWQKKIVNGRLTRPTSVDSNLDLVKWKWYLPPYFSYLSCSRRSLSPEFMNGLNFPTKTHTWISSTNYRIMTIWGVSFGTGWWIGPPGVGVKEIGQCYPTNLPLVDLLEKYRKINSYHLRTLLKRWQCKTTS